MKTTSDPREWCRSEELACDRARRNMRQQSMGGSLAPMYVVAGLIGAGVLYLLLVLAGTPSLVAAD